MTPQHDDAAHRTPRDRDDAALATAAALWIATFGTEAVPDDEDAALELCAERGPHVQNLVSDAIHRHGFARFVDAVRAAGAVLASGGAS